MSTQTGGVSGIDGYLQVGGIVSGTVTATSTGAPLAGVRVRAAMQGEYGIGGGLAVTDAAGHYTIRGVAPGRTSVCFDGSTATTGPTPHAYRSECYDNRPALTEVPWMWSGLVDEVTISAGVSTTGIDAALDSGASITGRVTRTDNTPVPGATVTASTPGRSTTTATTNPDGTYIIGGLQPGTFTICIDATTSPTTGTGLLNECWNNQPWPSGTTPPLAATPITITTGTSTTTGIDAQLSAAGAITGHLTDPNGTPITGATVTAYTPGATPSSTTTATDGTYTITNLTPGTYRICYSATTVGTLAYPYLRSECHNDLAWAPYLQQPRADSDPVTVTSGALVTIDTQLAARPTIVGMVSGPNGAPAGRVSVDVYTSTGMPVGWSQADSTGHYAVPLTSLGSYTVCFKGSYAVSAAAPGGNLDECYDNVPQPSSALPAGTTPITLTATSPLATANASLALAPAPTTTGIGGTVTSTAGHPLEGVSVVIRNGAGNPVTYASTDANGSYTATGLTGGGAYYVCFDGHYASGGLTSATGFAAECHNDRPWDGASGGPVPAGATAVSVAANAITTVNASLAPGGGISGKVTTTTGSGIAGVWVTAYDARNGYYQGDATTSATGAYTFGLHPGNYVVCFSADNVRSLTGYLNECWNDAADQASATPISVTGTSVVPNIDAQLTAGSVIAGQVTDGSRPIGGVQVTAFDAMGNAVASGSTKLDGTFRVTGLRSAPYAVCVGGVSATGLSPTGYAPECYDNQPWDGVTPPATVTTVTPPVAGTSTVNVVLAAGGAIAGQVTDGTLPLPQARVTVSSAAGLWQQVSVGADGRYLVAGLPADTYTVCFDEIVTAGTGHLEECWNNVPVTGAPTPVVVTAGSTTTANAALASAGGIGGQVTDATGTPLGGYGSVSVYDTSGAFVVSSYVRDGHYLVTGLAPGSYVVCVSGTEFRGSSPTGYRSECHNDVVWSVGMPPPAGTTPVAVTAGSFQLVTLPLEPTPGVMGRVTAPDGTGIASVSVRLSASNSPMVLTATTDSAGRYVVSAPIPGSYRLCFSTEYATGSSPSGYLPECWNDVPMPPGNLNPPAGAATLSVTGLTTADAQLAVGAGFTGTLSSDTPGLTIAWSNVSIYSDTGSYLQAVSANGSTYAVRGLPAGSYFICFDAYAPTGTAPLGGFRHECFNDAATTTTATAVATSIGTVTTVNASLAPALAIVGTVSDSAGGALSGGAVYAFPTGGGGSFQGSWIDPQGHFVIGRLEAGTYTVCVDARSTSGASATGYLSECFQDVAWDPAAGFVTPAGTTGVTTTSVTTPTIVNFVLAPRP